MQKGFDSKWLCGFYGVSKTSGYDLPGASTEHRSWLKSPRWNTISRPARRLSFHIHNAVCQTYDAFIALESSVCDVRQ